jgi:cysteine desulfurase
VIRLKVYLDNNASSRVSESVIKAMMPYMRDIIAPPNSDYGISAGVEANSALEKSRVLIAKKLNVIPQEIVFTSGQAESNNLAIKGIAFANLNHTNKLILASSISHSSVLDSLSSLKKFGFKFELIKVDSEGFLDKRHLIKLLEMNPLLVSISHGNGEIGTLENIETIAAICHEYNIPIHVEASYSFCKTPLDASKLDLVTITSHLIHGPKGVGALKIRKGLKITSLVDGGLQEDGRRGGTENIPGIVGFAKAVEEYNANIVEKTRKLRDNLWELMEKKITDFQITGAIDRAKRLPNHYSVVINYVEGESILLHLDLLGFMIATGSACSSKRLKASHVLTAIGLPTEISHGSVRVGLSHYNTQKELELFVENLKTVIKRLREMSPMDAQYMKEWNEMKSRGEVIEEDHQH